MSNENLEIKYFQIGLEPEIFPAHDIDSVKEYLVKHNWPKEYIQDIDDGNYKLVSPDFEFKDDDGDKHKLSEWFLRDRTGQLIPGQVLELE
ncbi:MULTISPECIES: hypothetical protein [Snodgrassella]|uniref:hypothetical protein n=1 Tax=Snodgrassella TaxID=1193515 RepID=UPI000815E0F2|nr:MULTISPECIES: hypothetical protein [Snodgrassella]SCC08396.1 hypothetical protein GA0061082_10878 [Snodgrassella sp. R-53583]